MNRKRHMCLCVLNKSLLWMVHYINDLSVWLGAGRAELMFERSGAFSQVTDSVCLQVSKSGAVCVSKRGRAHSDKRSPAGVFRGVWMWIWFYADIFSWVMWAAVRHNDMCNLPFTVTGELQVWFSPSSEKGSGPIWTLIIATKHPLKEEREDRIHAK